MTKGAIDALTRAQALDLAEYGIRVNCVAPGPIVGVRTPRPGDRAGWEAIERVPLRCFGVPLDIAAAVAFLASPDAVFITGQVLYVDGGLTAQLTPRHQPI
jgi:3-oxoacyl-[acyl-carrier protein] reductase